MKYLAALVLLTMYLPMQSQEWVQVGSFPYQLTFCGNGEATYAYHEMNYNSRHTTSGTSMFQIVSQKFQKTDEVYSCGVYGSYNDVQGYLGTEKFFNGTEGYIFRRTNISTREIFYTNNGGSTWTKTGFSFTYQNGNPYSQFPYYVGKNNIYVISSNPTAPAKLQRYLNGKEVLNTNFPFTAYAKMTFVNDSVAFSSYSYSDSLGKNYAYKVYKTIDYCKTWTNVFSGDSLINSIKFSNASNGLISDYNGKLFQTKDGGETWKDVSLSTNTIFNSIVSRSDSIYYALELLDYNENSNKIYYSFDYGDNWYVSTLDASTGFSSISCPTDVRCFIQDEDGKIFSDKAFNVALTKSDNSIKLYPNPSFDDNTIQIELLSNDFEVFVFDDYGNLVKEVKNTHAIEIGELSNGIYLIKVKYDGQEEVIKFVKN